MTRDNVPAPAQPSSLAPVQPSSGIVPADPPNTAGAEASGAVPVQPTGPAPVVQQAASGTDVPAAIVQGAAQGMAKAFMTRLTEKFLADPPDWIRALGSVFKGLRE
ncbi:hypothetical protein ACWDNT_12430 [Streptomyces sp. NPDC000963]|uniref:hypothetical protein n=1 Tax=Streptomyces sp. NPDC007872 TaxID=3364782 RepID=UPI0036B3BC08